MDAITYALLFIGFVLLGNSKPIDGHNRGADTAICYIIGGAWAGAAIINAVF
jgi:hypothetical protein